MVVLGAALAGLMGAAVDAWRRGEADRQVHERLQALQRQLADDLAAAVVDPPPVPDFHYVLDTLHDLPDPADPYYIIHTTSELKTPKEDTKDGTNAKYFTPDGSSASAEVVLRIPVPFPIGAALLHARMDCSATGASAELSVGPDGTNYQPVETLTGEGISGGERDISQSVLGGEAVFVRVVLHNDGADTAQFLRGDRLRSEGRPVLILDCYKDPNALAQRARPTFHAFWRNGAQIVSWTRTIPGEMEKAELRQQALGGRGQVVYRWEPYPAEANKPGLGILRRSFQVPLPTTLNVDAIPADEFHDFLTHVLHFSLSFWGADTTVWETQPELDPSYASRTPTPHPPSQRWLSSRYLPEQVQVTLVLEPDQAKRTSVGLRGDLTDSQTGSVSLTSVQGFPRSNQAADFVHDFLRDPRHFVKIDNEWLYFERADERTNAIVVPATGRGARGTTAAAHVAGNASTRGAEVTRGRVFVFTVPVPAYRHWQR
jgi:hypothetical protein